MARRSSPNISLERPEYLFKPEKQKSIAMHYRLLDGFGYSKRKQSSHQVKESRYMKSANIAGGRRCVHDHTHGGAKYRLLEILFHGRFSGDEHLFFQSVWLEIPQAGVISYDEWSTSEVGACLTGMTFVLITGWSSLRHRRESRTIAKVWPRMVWMGCPKGRKEL